MLVTAPGILGQTLLLNGVEFGLVDGGTLPEIWADRHEGAGLPMITVHPLSCTFVVFR